MADEPAMPATTEVIPSREGGVSAIASAHAPFLFFDVTTAFGYYNGIVHVGLGALRFSATEGGVKTDHVTVAHLRMNVAAAQALHDALEKALLMAAPVPEGQKH